MEESEAGSQLSEEHTSAKLPTESDLVIEENVTVRTATESAESPGPLDSKGNLSNNSSLQLGRPFDASQVDAADTAEGSIGLGIDSTGINNSTSLPTSHLDQSEREQKSEILNSLHTSSEEQEPPLRTEGSTSNSEFISVHHPSHSESFQDLHQEDNRHTESVGNGTSPEAKQSITAITGPKLLPRRDPDQDEEEFAIVTKDSLQSTDVGNDLSNETLQSIAAEADPHSFSTNRTVEDEDTRRPEANDSANENSMESQASLKIEQPVVQTGAVKSSRVEPTAAWAPEDQVDPAWGFSSGRIGIDHTNSFPAVPTISSSDGFEAVEPLPRSQAGGVLEEMEHSQGSTFLNDGNDNRDMWTINEFDADNEANFFADVNGTAVEVPKTPLNEEAKFEEGLPLVPHEEHVQSTAEARLDENSSIFDVSLGKGDDEDFLQKLSAPVAEQDSSEHPKSLGRKSTEQVLAGVQNPANRSINHTLDDSDKGELSMTVLETNGQNPFEESFEESVLSGTNEPDQDPSTNASKEDNGNLALWEAVLDDDDLLEDEPGVDPSAFFDDDGEGFLDDQSQNLPPHSNTSSAPDQQSSVRSVPQYAPATNVAEYPGSGNRSYTPGGYAASPVGTYNRSQSPFAVQPLPQPPAMERAQSFSDKSKGGYSSPYDAPMDLSRPKRKPAAPHAQTSSGRDLPSVPPPPPRSSSIQSTSSATHTTYAPSPATTFNQIISSPVTSTASLPTPTAPRPQPKPSPSSFFEDLPAVSKPRPSNVNRFVPPSSQAGPPPSIATPPQMISPPQVAPSPQMPLARSQHVPPPATNQNPSSFGLVQPDRTLPFTDQPQSLPAQQVSAPSNRCSPAPISQPLQSNDGRYAPSGPNAPPRAPSVSHILPFQPRTSSPLARSASTTQQYHPSAQTQDSTATTGGFLTGARRPSLKTTQTVHPTSTGPNVGTMDSSAASRAATYHHPLQQNQVMTPGDQTFEVPNETKSSFSDVMPPRSEIEAIGRPQARPRSNTPTRQPQSINQPDSGPWHTSLPLKRGHVRGPSIHESLNFIPPVDGREDDPLKRWQGTPIFSFGFGGNIVTSFPHRVPRYAAGQVIPMIKCSPGEIKVSSGKLLPLEEHIATFPGPLKSKSKKKDVLAWLQKRIQGLEQEYIQEMPNVSPDIAKRREEKILLWKLLRIVVEMDGAIDANNAAEIAVRDLLSPESRPDEPVDQSPEVASVLPTIPGSSVINQSEGTPGTKPVPALKSLLLRGEREKAVWYAVDRKLWGHAMMIASTMSRDIWKQVAQEFVRHGVKASGENVESLAALYDVFAGNCEESVDQLVPPSTRAGLQMVSKSAPSGPARNALDGLDKWRETLSLILSNRSPDDTRSMVALGRLLASYGRVEAAHICFMFSKLPGLFGGADDPHATVVLLGANHRYQLFDYAKDFDSILLTEIYEFAYAVLSPSASSITTPHLQAFKLYHAEMLAEYGHRDEAQQYCDAISNTIKATTKASAYFHPRLYNALEELNNRLRQSPKDGSGSWISKPSMDKVSGSVWNKFTSFVVGDDSDTASVASGRPDTDGPFARVNGETPTISRASSPAGAFGSYNPNGGFGLNAAPAPPPNSRYTPAIMYNPRPPLENSASQTGVASTASSSPEILLNQAAGNNPHLPQPANSIFPPGQGRHITQAPSRLRYGPEVPTHGQFDSSIQQSNVIEPPSSSSLSDGDISRPTSHHSQHSIQEQLLSPNEARQKSQKPSPMSDRYSPSYQPRSPNHAPRSASYEPRPASYEPRSATYEPRSYAPSPVRDHSISRPPDDAASSSYEPTAPVEASEAEPHERPYEPPSYSYEPPSALLEPPMSATTESDHPVPSSYEPVTSSYEPPGSEYEPPSYDLGTNGDVSSPVKSPRKKKSFMDLSDDEDDFAARAAALKKVQKAEKDRAANDAFRKAAEADAQRDSRPAPPLNSKSSWFGGLFGGGKAKENVDADKPLAGKTKPIRAKLGEENSFYYDAQLKKWVNKNAGSDAAAPSAPTPPPPRGPPSRTVSSVGPSTLSRPPTSNPPSQLGLSTGPASGPPSAISSRNASPSIGTLVSPTATSESPVLSPPMAGPSDNGPPAGLPAGLVPPSRPSTGMSEVSNASSLDDLIGAPQARQGGTVRRMKKKKGYVDVMAK